MSEWIIVPQNKVKKVIDQPLSGKVNIRLLVSPYDIPDAVRGYFDNGIKRFIIEFKYIGNEPWKVINGDQDIALRIGDNSKRLYGMEIDIKKLRAKNVNLNFTLRREIDSAIANLIDRSSTNVSARSNYKIANNAINISRSRLLSNIHASPI